VEPRQRFLSIEGAKWVWVAGYKLDYPWGPAMRLLLLTGCRESEICSVRWAWFDGKAGTLLIPPEHYKSGRDFLVTLPCEAVAIVDGITRFNGGDFMLTTTN